jgi:pimeloyl-ACP methyl ester carboxylesterase
MTTFVLVHGAWHDGSAFTSTIKHLGSRGHSAFAPTLAGNGKNADKHVDHPRCTQSVVDYIVGRDLTDIVLLGHSFGGTIIQKVSEAIPERIRRLIFLNAFILSDGSYLLGETPPPFESIFSALAHTSPDSTVTLPFDLWRDAFINGSDPELVRSTYEMLSPQPFQPMMARLDVKRFFSLNIPASVICCSNDLTLPAGDYHPRMSSRLGTFRLIEMHDCHEVMFTNPAGLADNIIEAARD